MEKAKGRPSHADIAPLLRANAKRMRRAMTEAERRFWHAVRAGRAGGLVFRRQVPIAGYIVDFVCHEKRLIVEIDGATHGTDAEITHDRLRTMRLEREGYRVLRYWNDDIVRNLPDVLDHIILETDPSPRPSPTRGEGHARRRGRE